MEIFTDENPTKTFEIDLVIRDVMGNPTKKRKSYSSDSAYKIWQFWNRYRGKPKRKKERVPSAKEAEKIVTNLYGNE